MGWTFGTPARTVKPMLTRFATLCSAIVPGLGQLLQRRLVDAALLFGFALWLHVILGAFAWGVSADVVWDGALWGVLGVPDRPATPTGTVTTVLMFATHLFAAWDVAHEAFLPRLSRA